jgi:hypothetical protein
MTEIKICDPTTEPEVAPADPLWWERRVGSQVTLQLANGLRYYMVTPRNELISDRDPRDPAAALIAEPILKGVLVEVVREFSGEPVLLIRNERFPDGGFTTVGVHPVDVAFVTFCEERRIQT